MENVTLVFKGSNFTGTEKTELVCEVNYHNEIMIEITDTDANHDYNCQTIYLSKQTAVRLVRELKKQIGNIESEEVNHG